MPKNCNYIIVMHLNHLPKTLASKHNENLFFLTSAAAKSAAIQGDVIVQGRQHLPSLICPANYLYVKYTDAALRGCILFSIAHKLAVLFQIFFLPASST